MHGGRVIHEAMRYDFCVTTKQQRLSENTRTALRPLGGMLHLPFGENRTQLTVLV